MKYKYTAKIHLDDGKMAKKHGDKISKLMEWMQDEAQKNFCTVNGEIIDNKLHRIIKHFQYSPFDAI
ncbi:hypothetical protein [Legionella brunensis]|uniref:Uncharacterized protein n=1 Tax=Legionella brunensis TaxID=29422 RepID=A0A0W0STD1_9GAMM|nr:hypothetical protein [Legionella brunensis]KTC86634.1 hypothetical protein Lbru_0575 [Legionella brunensis]